eukprot:scaffold3031_cov285-Pinguiococcus_pyrenoidosus.AAC.9
MQNCVSCVLRNAGSGLDSPGSSIALPRIAQQRRRRRRQERLPMCEDQGTGARLQAQLTSDDQERGPSLRVATCSVSPRPFPLPEVQDTRTAAMASSTRVVPQALSLVEMSSSASCIYGIDSSASSGSSGKGSISKGRKKLLRSLSLFRSSSKKRGRTSPLVQGSFESSEGTNEPQSSEEVSSVCSACLTPATPAEESTNPTSPPSRLFLSNILFRGIIRLRKTAGSPGASGSSPRVLSGQYSSLGGRGAQEDRVVIVHDLNKLIPRKRAVDRSVRRSVYAVFGGFNGNTVSDHLSRELARHLAHAKSIGIDAKRALREARTALENDVEASFWLNYAAAEPNGSAGEASTAGASCTVVFIEGTKLYTANCGNSRAVAITHTGKSQELTCRHDVYNADEHKRVVKAGAHVRREERLPCNAGRERQLRLFPGGLHVTRAFGAFPNKVESFGGVYGGLVSDFGEIKELDLLDDDVSLVLLGTEGFWNGLQGRKASALLQQEMKNQRAKMTQVARKLVEHSQTSARAGVDKPGNASVVVLNIPEKAATKVEGKKQ